MVGVSQQNSVVDISNQGQRKVDQWVLLALQSDIQLLACFHMEEGLL